MSGLCLNFCCFEGDGLLATRTCLDRKYDKIRHSETGDVLIHAYGLLVGGKGSSLLRMMAGMRWMEGSRHQSPHLRWGLALAVGVNPTEIIEMTGFVTAVKKSFKGNINSQPVVLRTSSAVCFCSSQDYKPACVNKGNEHHVIAAFCARKADTI